MSKGEEVSVPLVVGVLCIQGAFIEHIKILERLRNQHGYHHIRVVDVREPSQLSHLDGLIIPGGESTTLSVFLGKNGFEGSLREWLFGDPPGGVLWGTCAGLIMVANKLTEQKKGGQITLGGLDVECSRNVHGRQAESFESPIALHSKFFSDNATCHGVFIRAPGISKVSSPEVEILGTLEPEGIVVAVQQKNIMATTFHPELTEDDRWHKYFIQKVLQHRTNCNS